MALIFDTNALSAFADGDTKLRKAVEDHVDLVLPIIVLGEYLFGIRHSRWRARYETWLRGTLRLFVVLELGAGTAERYAEIRSELKTAGRPIPTNDLWVAALTREHGHALLTRDAHFEAVRGLHRVTW
jgi:tRNA(fMet)-specific endonuclease VapC